MRLSGSWRRRRTSWLLLLVVVVMAVGLLSSVQTGLLIIKAAAAGLFFTGLHLLHLIFLIMKALIIVQVSSEQRRSVSAAI